MDFKFPGLAEPISNVCRVIKADNFSSKLVAVKSFVSGQIICRIEGITVFDQPNWDRLQINENSHAALNSDLTFLNHSCDPSVLIDLNFGFVIAAKNIQPDQELTFFYPSTEWKMSQPFQCWCGSSFCIKDVSGACSLDENEMKNHFFNKHILAMKLNFLNNKVQ